MKYSKNKLFNLFVMFFVLVLFPKQGMSADSFPTIEDLTKGKVKIGDTIDKNNVDLIKDYLTPGTYDLVKMGLVMIMGSQIAPEKYATKAFREATERNRGKATIDENGIVYLKDGSKWPGGLPFPEPKTGLEVMANKTYGNVWTTTQQKAVMYFVDKNGERYKEVRQEMRYVYTNCRTALPPFGTLKGYEDVLYKRISVGTYPRELKGLGQFTIRYYDDHKNYDAGFVYLPSFRRTMRVSTTTWQDNIAGSDLTYGDASVFQEPTAGWDFKLLKDKAYLLFIEPLAPVPLVTDDIQLNEKFKFDVGYKFPRYGWAIYPTHVVEGIPRMKHLYSKKIIYSPAYPYWPASQPLMMGEFYDQQQKLWRMYVSTFGDTQKQKDGEIYYSSNGAWIIDCQTEHSTLMAVKQYYDNNDYQPEDITLQTLLAIGK